MKKKIISKITKKRIIYRNVSIDNVEKEFNSEKKNCKMI